MLDQVAMTYQVRSSDARSGGGRFSRRGGLSGVRRTEVQALTPTSLVVERGESVGVIGTNGSGKSTLMKLITGQMRPTSGEVYATSTPIMLGVNAALVRQVSGEDNIRLGCLAMGMSPREADAKRDTIAHLSGLDNQQLQLPLKAYSAGMASRLQFAIAASVDPDILVIDEALNTGDAQFRSRTQRRIDELRAHAGCVLLVSHSLDTIRQMCSRVLWLERGVLSFDGSPDEVTQTYSRYTKLRAAGEDEEADHLLQDARTSVPRARIRWVTGPAAGVDERPRSAAAPRHALPDPERRAGG
ncbi:ABC transporter ATP-binding protein [uncultured Micrococcus sp.]|uniref:ABC transporter ATP-binding protein n=1 Tax=uncultured Micrococcus sp. TaxID=114051 RepID=UPI0025CE9E43|nr:ABC transporter ATP-binding protein [uncultured Micrococcus sp.]